MRLLVVANIENVQIKTHKQAGKTGKQCANQTFFVPYCISHNNIMYKDVTVKYIMQNASGVNLTPMVLSGWEFFW